MFGAHAATSVKPGTSKVEGRSVASAGDSRSASVGQAATHAGDSPASRRWWHRWHFVITPRAASYLGAPNGQAISQYWHPMQRSGRCTTTPSARFS